MSLFARLESWGDRHAEAVECSAIDLQPNVLALHETPSIANHSKMIYANQALHDALYKDKLAFVASGLPHEGPSSTELDGEITRVEGLESCLVPLPFSLSQKVRLLDRLEDIETFGTAQVHWDSAETNEDIFAAISFGCLALARAGGRGILLRQIPRFSIGSEFYASLHKVQAGPGQPRGHLILECCCRIIMGEPKNEVKPMGRPVQTVRPQDKATAWRTHVTKGHEGSRLMLWRSNETYEFANVGVKHEVYIAKGNAAERYRHDW